MATQPNYELLREAAAIIDGIPANRFDLSNVLVNKDRTKPVTSATDCGAIGCAMGWLGLHPKFRALGLETEFLDASRSDYSYKRQIVRWHGAEADVYETAGALFGVDFDAAWGMFSPNNDVGSDKRVFRRRVVAFLKANGQPVAGA